MHEVLIVAGGFAVIALMFGSEVAAATLFTFECVLGEQLA